MSSNPSRIYVEEVAVDQNASLDLNSTEESDGNIADMEQSMDKSGTFEQSETLSEAEVTPRSHVMGEAHSTVSDDEVEKEEEEDSSSSSTEQSDSSISLNSESDAIEREHSPNTVVDVNDVAGNEDINYADSDNQILAEMLAATYPKPDEAIDAEVGAEQEVEEAKEDAVEATEADAEPDYEVEVEVENEPENETEIQVEVPEAVDETAEVMSPINRPPSAIDMEVQQQPEQLEKRYTLAMSQYERISGSSIDEGKSDDNEDGDDEEDDDDDDDEDDDDDDEYDEDDEDDDDDEDDEDDDDIVENEASSVNKIAAASDRKDTDYCNLPLKKIEISAHPEKVYYIRRHDGTVHAGHVLESRVTDNSSRTPNEYYVHYLGLNRRLDGWVGRHRISDNADDLGGITVPSTSTGSSGGLTGGHKRQGNKDYYLSACENHGYDYSDKKMTRYQKRRNDEINHVQKSHAELTASMVQLEKEHEQITKVKYIDKLIFGYYEIDAWYFSPFPGEYGKARVLYVCEFCLKYMRLEKSYSFHLYDCKKRHPPGREIYRKGTIAIYEVIGREQPLYCQLLSLTAKLFLDHKVLYFDMEPFLFYILCEIDNDGSHCVGYFSKERNSLDNNNVACILVMPPHQRKGYGKLLIAFSYVLSRKEGVIGSPEKPLSDLGRLSYRSYWAYTLLELMRERCSAEQTTIKELSEASGITQDDIIYTLQSMKMIKYWKGQNTICVTPKTINDHLKLPQFKRPKLTIDLNCLSWKPLKK
ncbi:histone acetyltransferase KAT8 [Drosophila grimshawi]|uniref:Histone acetyltransferase n=1 Tax=Drosophila grimshawi TaxID=7222 RepID=B4JRS4_DROGR|nr:histone acetyltransferase KAT8 [Drosophila grimshawi]EDV94464.1 GH19608 [Drosophila grimshawi]